MGHWKGGQGGRDRERESSVLWTLEGTSCPAGIPPTEGQMWST